MAHSVEQHLQVQPAAYDASIRRFVPGYETMLGEVVLALAEHGLGGQARVLDLGAGTGALSERLALVFPLAQLTLLDADPAMLEAARGRLAGHLARVELRRGSFSDPLPPCEVAVASLALHHLHFVDAKRDTYRGLHQALVPGGLLIVADAFVPADPPLARALMERWADHLVEQGDSREQAFARFAAWAVEDRYLGIDEELGLLAGAGFAVVEVRWRVGPMAVLVARKAPAG